MAISIDWPTKVITVNQSDCTLISGSLYELDTETVFRAQVNALSAGEEGMPFQRPIDHQTDYTVFGATYARKIELINGYSWKLLPDTSWACRLAGSNNNLADVENGVFPYNSNVLVIPQNSSGLISNEFIKLAYDQARIAAQNTQS